jgi:hypothetical protein
LAEFHQTVALENKSGELPEEEHQYPAEYYPDQLEEIPDQSLDNSEEIQWKDGPAKMAIRAMDNHHHNRDGHNRGLLADELQIRGLLDRSEFRGEHCRDNSRHHHPRM